MESKTKGQVEAKISEAMTKFEIAHMGRGPCEVKTYIIEDMVIVRLKGVMTPAERQLSESPEGIQLVKQIKTRLLEGSRKILENIIRRLVDANISSLYTDISTKTGERFIIFCLDKNLERKFRKK